MAVDRYTKLVLTVIAVCLVWLSVGGPSLMAPVSAQQDGLGDRVVLAGWVDEKGSVVKFPEVPSWIDKSRSLFEGQRIPRAAYPLPMAEAYPR